MWAKGGTLVDEVPSFLTQDSTSCLHLQKRSLTCSYDGPEKLEESDGSYKMKQRCQNSVANCGGKDGPRCSQIAVPGPKTTCLLTN